MNKGLTLPNRQWDDFTPDEIKGLNDLAPQTLVWIVYDVAYEQNRDHRLVVQTYIDAHPGTKVLVRPYAENILLMNPKDWAIECKKRLDWTWAEAEVIPANEMNLEGGQYAEDWNYQCSWLVSFAGAWQDLKASYRTHLPALSPSGDYQKGWAVYSANQVNIDFDVVDAHVYSMDQVGALANLPRASGQPASITEFNQVLPATMFDAVKDLVDDCTYFLLGGTADQSQYDILKQPTNYESFKNWNGGSPVADPTIAELTARVAALEQRDHDINEALKAIANGEYRGAGSLDGWITSLQGGTPFVGTFEPAPKAPAV